MLSPFGLALYPMKRSKPQNFLSEECYEAVQPQDVAGLGQYVVIDQS